MRVVLVCTIVAGLAAGACSSDPSESASPAPPATARSAEADSEAAESESSAPPPAAVLDDGPAVAPVPANLPAIVARVNGQEITRVALEETIAGIEADAGTPLPPEQRDRVYRQVLDELIAQRLLVQEALRRVTVSADEVDAYIQEVRSQFATAEQFQQMLQAEGLTLEALRANLQIELAVAKLLQDEIGSRIQPSADVVSAYYRENREQFRQARVRASHILFTVPPYADAAARLQARQRAEAALAQIRNGRDFAAIAREQSQDPGSAERGGDLGYFDWGEMMEPLNQVAFSLEPNAATEIVESPRGYHVVRVTDRQPGTRIAPFDEVRPQIESLLAADNEQRETAAFVQTLREKGRIQIYF